MRSATLREFVHVLVLMRRFSKRRVVTVHPNLTADWEGRACKLAYVVARADVARSPGNHLHLERTHPLAATLTSADGIH